MVDFPMERLSARLPFFYSTLYLLYMCECTANVMLVLIMVMLLFLFTMLLWFYRNVDILF